MDQAASASPAPNTATLPIVQYYSGDDDAFCIIDAEWRRRLIHFLLNMGAPQLDAEDLVQEAFLRMARSRFHPEYKRYDPSRGTFEAFVFAMVRNVYVDYIRRRKRRPETLSLDDDTEDVHTLAEPSVPACQMEELIKSEGVIRFRALLASLPEGQRLVVILRDFEDLQYNEIAEILQIPLNTVVSRRRLGLERIRVLWTGIPGGAIA
jgi:RNA polymerase sigma-70 factor (ECF subfamily)